MRPRLTENPWFWLMLFGSLGAAGVVVIGPKYAARHARLERMAETRERVNAAKELGTAASEVRKIKPGAGASATGGLQAGGLQTGDLQASGPRATGSPTGGSATGGSATGGSATGGSAPEGPIEPYVESDFQRRPQLTWLLGLMIALMLGGTAGMIHSRRRQAV